MVVCFIFSIKHHLLINTGPPTHGCITVHKLTPGLQYMPRSCRKGMVNAPSGHTCAIASCKLLYYANVKLVRMVEKFPRRKLQDSSRWTRRKSSTNSNRKNTWCRTRYEGVHVSKEDSMDQSWTNRYSRFVRLMAFHYSCFLICHECFDIMRWE